MRALGSHLPTQLSASSRKDRNHLKGGVLWDAEVPQLTANFMEPPLLYRQLHFPIASMGAAQSSTAFARFAEIIAAILQSESAWWKEWIPYLQHLQDSVDRFQRFLVKILAPAADMTIFKINNDGIVGLLT